MQSRRAPALINTCHDDRPMPFLRFFYDTFPAVDGASAGAAVVVEPERAGGNGVNDSASDGGASSDVHPNFTVFKQTACHLAHEANVEKVFSRAGLLADPNLLRHTCRHLSWLVSTTSTRNPSNHSSMPSRTSIMRCSATRVARKPRLGFRV